VSSRGIFLIPVLVLAAAVAVTGFMSVSRTEYATGWDGYYYLVQIKSLEIEGEMHSPEYSLIYLPLMFFKLLTGDYLAAYRITAVLVKVLFVLSVYALSLALLKPVCRDRRGIRWTALATAAASAASPALNYFFTQFPKNLLGFSLLFFLAASLVAERGRWRTRGFSWRGAAASALLFLAAFFTHRFSAVLSLLFLLLYLGPAVLGNLYQKVSRGGRGSFPKILAAVLLLLTGVLFLSNRLPLAPSLSDLERVTPDLSSSPVFVPGAFASTFGSFRLSGLWQAEIWAGGALLLVTLMLLPWKKLQFLRLGGGYYSVLVLSLTGLFPFFRFHLMGISHRLYFGTMLMMPLVLLPWIRAVTAWMTRRFPTAIAGAAVPIILLAASFLTYGSYDPEIHDPPYEYYQELSDDIMEVLEGVDHELIVAHKALAEVITFRHMEDALPWSPEERFQRDRVWRVTAGVMRLEARYYLGPAAADSLFFRLRGDYGLMREDAWEDFLMAVSSDPVMVEALDSWRNPMEVRPVYLTGETR